MTSAAPLFPHTQDQLKEIAAGILRYAAQGGASSAAVEISEGSGFSVTVRRAGLADAHCLEGAPPALDLFHPWRIDTEAAAELARRAEQAAFDAGARIRNS